MAMEMVKWRWVKSPSISTSPEASINVLSSLSSLGAVLFSDGKKMGHNSGGGTI